MFSYASCNPDYRRGSAKAELGLSGFLAGAESIKERIFENAYIGLYVGEALEEFLCPGLETGFRIFRAMMQLLQ